LLYTHPKVADAAVIGLPDPVLGERCCAVVACRAEPLAFAEMVEFLIAKQLMRQKIPEQLEIVAEVPRNAAGKIQKQLLRERFSWWGGRAGGGGRTPPGQRSRHCDGGIALLPRPTPAPALLLLPPYDARPRMPSSASRTIAGTSFGVGFAREKN